MNFEERIALGSKYDLAISLEVAEHISPDAAELFFQSLTDASDFVLFSAAIPFQGGTTHVNERWPDYWAGLFARNDYTVIDFIRRQIWNDSKIPFRVRQSILLFAKRSRACRVRCVQNEFFDGHLDSLYIVHPEKHLSLANDSPGVKRYCKLLIEALKNFARKRSNGSS